MSERTVAQPFQVLNLVGVHVTIAEEDYQSDAVVLTRTLSQEAVFDHARDIAQHHCLDAACSAVALLRIIQISSCKRSFT